MKKINIVKNLEEVNATCNFCGEKNKECVRGSILFEFCFEKPLTSIKRVIEDYDYNIFGQKTIKGYEFKHVVESWKQETYTDYPDICKDCIKQLANLLKK